MIHRRRTDDELDRLLAGREPDARAPIAAALRELRDELPQEPDPATVRAHLAAITTAAAEAAHAAPSAAPPVTSGWRIRMRRVLGLTAVKVGLTATAAVAATATGLATTGHLPDPAQRVVAEVADRIGLQLPAPDAAVSDTSDDPAPAPEQVPTGPVTRDEPAAPAGQDGDDLAPADEPAVDTPADPPTDAPRDTPRRDEAPSDDRPDADAPEEQGAPTERPDPGEPAEDAPVDPPAGSDAHGGTDASPAAGAGEDRDTARGPDAAERPRSRQS